MLSRLPHCGWVCKAATRCQSIDRLDDVVVTGLAPAQRDFNQSRQVGEPVIALQ